MAINPTTVTYDGEEIASIGAGQTATLKTQGDKTEHDIVIKAGGGITFIPSIDAEGNLSWQNNGNLPNPATVKVKGEDGKSAYAYAQDGGFFGTEAQLSAKLATPMATPQMYGGTDDVAIQAAINAADYVLLPEGNYTINNPVIIPSEKKIQIEGRS